MKILIVDDHAVIRAGLKQLCGDFPRGSGGATVLEADNGEIALALQKSERPQLTILDLNMPGVSGLELLRQLLEADSAARILVFSMHGEPVYAAKALQIGARGYVSKNASPEELRLALSRIASGLTYVEGEIAQALAALPVEQRQRLSERDLEILRLLGEGRSFSERRWRRATASSTTRCCRCRARARISISNGWCTVSTTTAMCGWS